MNLLFLFSPFFLGNYSKFDLPNETQTLVHVGIDIKDIPKIDDQEYSITLNAFFVVRWTDERMIIDQEKMEQVCLLCSARVFSNL